MALFYPAEDVRYARIDDALILLDLKSERYVAFDPIATRMWQALTSDRNLDSVVTELERASGGDAEIIARDLTAFQKRCIDSGYLQSAPAEPQDSAVVLPVRRVAAYRAWWIILRTVRRLRRLGFSKTYRLYGRIAKATAGKNSAVLDDAVEAFRKAENFIHIPNSPQDCLPRSLALYRFLLSSGLAPTHLIGVQRRPFQAHAWVECDGRVVCDTREKVECYSVIARL